MIEDDKKRFADMMLTIGQVYGKEKRDINQITPIYFSALKGYDLMDVRAAFNAHIGDTDNGQFMPKPADIIRQIAGGKQSNALQAWSKVDKAIRSFGSYDSVCFDDPIIHKVIQDMGGWIDLCGGLEKEMPFKANEFEKRYQGYVGRNTSDYPKSLTGAIEADKSRRGIAFDEGDIVLIGDEQAALITYQHGDEGGKKTKTMAQLTGDLQKRLEQE